MSSPERNNDLIEARKEAEKMPMAAGVHFSAPFIKRPVATTLLSIAIILAGAVAYKMLPVASLPQVEFPVISVGAGLPGADPETVASAIVTPLERQFARIAGVNEMTSSSGLGNGSITMQFDLSRDVDGAARDVQAAINAARSQLPSNLPQNPGYRKINPADAPILILALTSDTLSVPQIYDACDSILAQKIAQVQGVGQTFCGGSAKPAVRIEANPSQLFNYGLGLEALRAAIGTVNVNQPKGYLQDETQRWSISTTDQLFGAAAYAPLIIATNRGPVSSAAASNGLPASLQSSVGSGSTTTSTSTSGTQSSSSASPAAVERGIVRIQDVAQVVDSVEDIHTGGSFNGKPAILVIVFKTSTANVIETVDNVLKLLPSLQAAVPPAVRIQVALDRTTTIRASVKDVTRTLIISIVLVILVVFVR
jgi:multidrug efflux pump